MAKTVFHCKGALVKWHNTLDISPDRAEEIANFPVGRVHFKRLILFEYKNNWKIVYGSVWIEDFEFEDVKYVEK